MAGPVVVMLAMEMEAEPVRVGLGGSGFERVGGWWPMLRSDAEVGGREVVLVVSGKDARTGVDLIGTQGASVSASWVVERLGPAVMVNVGFAGGFGSRGWSVGDALVCEPPFLFHDRRIPLAGFDRFGEGWIGGMDPSGLAEGLGLRRGRLSTGDAIATNDAERAFFAEHGVDVKDMEGAALAWVAGLAGVPFVGLKVVTDLVDGGESEAEQFEGSASELARIVGEVGAGAVGWLCGGGGGGLSSFSR